MEVFGKQKLSLQMVPQKLQTPKFRTNSESCRNGDKYKLFSGSKRGSASYIKRDKPENAYQAKEVLNHVQFIFPNASASFKKKMCKKYLIQNNFNQKRVLMTGPVKVDSSPYKISNKIRNLTEDELSQERQAQEVKLKHAHNVLLKKRINNEHFKINKHMSPKKMFNISPDDFVFEDRSQKKRDEMRAKFLKKYQQMKAKTKLRKKAKKVIKQLPALKEDFPEISNYTAYTNGKFNSFAFDSPRKLGNKVNASTSFQGDVSTQKEQESVMVFKDKDLMRIDLSPRCIMPYYSPGGKMDGINVVRREEQDL
ncbi:unnamed protein product [Moneuplotes crassus]|uniref:Uncharacterized protein n=1 Tax=Euplotes crassus TaxID=5936 RepID=A0AAD1XJV1_EUPCR|nr:unnamed protein product [Moneuplotes crassus]